MKFPRVLIIGGGFGGLYAARQFRDTLTEVTLVDRSACRWPEDRPVTPFERGERAAHFRCNRRTRRTGGELDGQGQ